MKTEESKRELYRQEREEEVSFSNPLEAAEFEHKLFQIIAKLPPASRSVFRMSRFDGKSNQEIAQELNISKRTVETHISNALKFLRKALFGQQGAGAVQRALLSFLV